MVMSSSPADRGQDRTARDRKPSSASVEKTDVTVPDVKHSSADDIVPAYMNQVSACRYLGVSKSYFIQFVDVTPIPFPGSGSRPVERYARVDLDAWAEKWRSPKARRSA